MWIEFNFSSNMPYDTFDTFTLIPLQHGVVVAHLEAEGDGVELGQLPDDQLGVRPVQAVRLVLARRVREALCSKSV